MNATWNVAGWPGWLNNARLIADLVIVAAGVAVARVLWQLLAGRTGKPPTRRAPRVLVASAALIALCGVSHLGVVLAGEVPTPFVPTALKVAAAALWVVTAMRFRTAADPGFCPSPAGQEPRSPGRKGEERAPLDTTRLEAKVRMLEDVFNNETWLLDKTDALKELREILSDLEARQCRT